MAVIPVGIPFLVNNLYPGSQYRPAISALANGGFAISWQDESGLGSPDFSDDVRFARFDAFGNRLTAAGTDTLANTTLDSAQFESSIAAFADGKFVMVWTDASETSPDFDNRSVRGQVFNADGTKSGSEFIVNSTFPLSQDEPSVTVLTNGKFVVTWSSEIVTASGATNIIGRVFNADGTPSGSEFTVNSAVAGDQLSSEVHALSTGGFAVVWDDNFFDPILSPDPKTFIRFYNAAGTATSAALLANSAAAGTPLEVDLAELSDGRVVVTYTDDDFTTGDGSGSAVRARIYNPATSTFGAVINVNTTTSNDQRDAQVAALDNGQFVVVWTDKSTTGGDMSFDAVRMQVFNSAGGKVGAEFLVNSTATTFEQRNPAVTVLLDGRFVVTWEDNSQSGADALSFAIRSRIYDARIAGIDIDGTSGSDNYQGSSFADTIEGLAGNDLIKGGGGIDIILGGLGIDTLEGEDGNDDLQGEDNNDTLRGGAGNDKLNGGLGNDTMEGGLGDDTYYVDSALDVVTELPNQGTDTVITTLSAYTLGANVEKLVLTAGGNANGTGNVLANTLTGNSFNNDLNGGTGIDSMTGGLGNDTYYVDNAGDSTVEAVNGGNDKVVSTITHALRINVEDLILVGTTNINGTGNALANTITGSGGDNILNGLAGADMMGGGEGNDTYYVDNALDSTNEIIGAGIDIVRSTVSWTLNVGTEKLYLLGTAANATGNTDSNFIYGNNSANIIDGKAGADRMWGGGGNDKFTVDSAGDLIFETIAGAAGGTDTVSSSVNHTLSVNVENLILTGANTINGTGNTSVNSITGNSATNFINGLLGSDTLAGGLGGDHFVFTTALGATNIDTITDYNVAADTIRIDNAVFAGLATGTLAVAAFHIGAAAADASDRIIYNNATGALLFDADGVGGVAAKQFATVAAGLVMTNADFFVI
ncbi:MAG: beta strand repeat-containing protein [Aestuariivirga sp.]